MKIQKNVIYNTAINTKNNYNTKDKIDKQALINNNNIKSINIINNNYNNIIINNKLTPNKKLIIKDKTFSINKKNYKILTLGNKPNLKNEVIKLTMNNQEQENDLKLKYKLIIDEKNNLINKLRNEIDYYKNKNQEYNPKLNDSNSIYSLFKNNQKLETVRNKIQEIYSQQKEKEIKLDNNLINNINEYNNIKAYNINNSEDIDVHMPQIIQPKTIALNSLEYVNNNYKYNNKLMFNYSLKNDLKLKNKLTLDLSNNYNSIENNTKNNTNRIYKYQVKSPKFLITSNSIHSNDNNNLIFNNNGITYDNKLDRKPSFQNIKKNKYNFNNIISAPFSLKKETINKKIVANYNLDSFLDKDNNNNNSNIISYTGFNYKEKYDNLKNRMTNLIENLFKLIENQNYNKNK